MRRARPSLLASLVLAVFVWPATALAAGGPAPTEACVPGTIWEDTASGVKYICIYDELYGGTRWELLSGGQTGSEAWGYRSSTHGCAFQGTGLTSQGGYGADAIIRTYRWPCRTVADRIAQPTGELRSRIVIQRFANTWTTCRDSGFRYNTYATTGWLAGLDMGTAADCGTGIYRAWGSGAFYQGGAWRGSNLYTPSMSFR